LRGEGSKIASTWLHFAYDIYKKAHKMASAEGEGFETYETDKVDEYSEGDDVGFFGMFKGKESH